MTLDVKALELDPFETLGFEFGVVKIVEPDESWLDLDFREEDGVEVEEFIAC